MTKRDELIALADLRRANVTRQKEWDAFDQLTLAYRGNELAGEVGEACNVIKKLERERLGIKGSRDTVEHLAEELADIIICTDLIAMQAGIDLSSAVIAKFNASSEKVGLKTRLAVRSDAPGGVEAPAAGDGEPVAWQFLCADGVWRDCLPPPEYDLKQNKGRFRQLYTAPPAGAGMREALEQIRTVCDEPFSYGRSHIANKIAAIVDEALTAPGATTNRSEVTASLEGDAVERVARIIDPQTFASIEYYATLTMPRDDEKAFEAYPDLKTSRDAALAKADAILSTIAPDEAAIRAAAFEEAAKIVTSRVEGIELQRFVFNGVTSTDTRGNDLFIAKSDVEKLFNDRAATIRSQEAGR